MAYVQSQEDTTNQNQALGPLNQPSTSSGAASGTVPSGMGGQGVTAVPNATKAPPVQDLAAYLTANQPQAVQMGQNIAGNIAQQATQVSGDINADQAALDAQVQAQNVQPNQQLISEAAANPTQFVQDPNNVAAFQAQENANYTGPANFEATPQYQTLTNEVKNAQQNAPNLNTNAGIQQLVTGQETNPTLGMENLDALLLQGTPGATAPIAAAEAPIQQLGTQFKGATTAEDSAIQAAIANDQAAPQAIQSAFLTGPNAVVPAWEKALQDELTSAQKQTTDYNNVVGSNTSLLNPYEGYLKQFNGVTGYNIDDPLTEFLSQNPVVNSPTLASVATPQDYATEVALSQLLGKGLGTTPIDQSTVSQAGTFKAPTATTANLQDLIKTIANSSTDATWKNLGPSYGNSPLPANNPYYESLALAPTYGGNGQRVNNPKLSAYEQLLANLESGSNGYIGASPLYGKGFYEVGTK